MSPGHHRAWALALFGTTAIAVVLAVMSQVGWPLEYTWPDLPDNHPWVFLRDTRPPWWPTVLFLGVAAVGATWTVRTRRGLTRRPALVVLGMLVAMVLIAWFAFYAWVMFWNE